MQLTPPLILTLSLDAVAAGFFDNLRQKHFPPERNHLKAHLTLFHHLPATEALIYETLEKWSRIQAPFLLQVISVVSIGKGVAYKIDCPPLVAFHKRLQQVWKTWLIPQDQQKLWPHITVQNKVSPQLAKTTLEQLQQDFVPFTAQGQQLRLWSYEGGPWRFLQHFTLSASSF
ncbi:MAG: hypothetical protein JWP88_724 [Flaviaesturariibacter sp.]|nr:hypothetical protein [Flaviaesturariibacter sp.]